MVSKMTRRAVLGGTAVALAVAPFVIRTLRAPKKLSLPLSDYELEWQKFDALTKAEIEESKGPSVFHLSNKAEDKRMQYVMLGSFYDDPLLPPLLSGIPPFSLMTLGEYWNEVRNSNLYLMGTLTRNESASVVSTMPNPNGTGDLLYLITEDSVTPGVFEGEKFHADTNLWSQPKYSESLYFPFCGEVKVEKTFVVPVRLGVRFKTTFKAVGFSRVDGRETARFTFTKDTDFGGEHDGTVYVDINTNLIVREEGSVWHKDDEGTVNYVTHMHYV